MVIRIISIFVFGLCISLFSTVQSRAGFGDGEQEWGYTTVRPGAHMFWWLFYTTNKKVESFYEKPLIIWLQGGPGASSTGYGNFEEIGPLNMQLEYRNYTWVENYNVLFIDNPVGSGFSYVDNDRAYATTNIQIATDLFEMMYNFYEKFPKFRRVPVYIVSESYGGKIAAEFALVWYQAEKSKSIESNLKGVALGDPWISPIDSVLTWGPFLLQMGFVDTSGYEQIQGAALMAKRAAAAGSWDLANRLARHTNVIMQSVTNGVDFYNVLTKVQTRVDVRLNSARSVNTGTFKRTSQQDIQLENLMNTVVKSTLNLFGTYETINKKVFNHLSNDFMRPVIHIMERLLDETDLKVIVYNGQLDLIVDTPGTLQWVEKMKWSYAEMWRTSPRTAITVDNIIEGYKKIYRNFAFYWVNRAGHMVPTDNPAATAVILREFTQN